MALQVTQNHAKSRNHANHALPLLLVSILFTFYLSLTTAHDAEQRTEQQQQQQQQQRRQLSGGGIATVLSDALLLTTPHNNAAKRRERSSSSISSLSTRTRPLAFDDEDPFVESCFPFSSVKHDYLLEHDKFLPDPKDAVPGKCHDMLANSLLHRLERLATPKTCSASKQFTTDNVGYGFGSVLNSWTKPYMYAIAHELSFWSPPLGSYRDGRGAQKSGKNNAGFGQRCELDSMACFLRPMSDCELTESLVGEPRHCRDGRHASGVEPRGRPCIPRIIAENRSLGPYSLMHTKNDGDGFPKNVPEHFRGRGHFFYTSMLLGFMLDRPNEDFAKALEEARAAAGFEAAAENSELRPLLSLHVRRGDSCSAEQMDSKKRRCDRLAHYMKEAVLPMAARYGVRSIFLATDDEATVRETEAYPQFNWLVVPGNDRSAVKTRKWEANLKDGTMDNYMEAQAALTDLLLMAEGDMFVGKFT